MNSVKCPQCGLTNFTSASNCKRCRLEFTESMLADAVALKTDAVAYSYWPPPNPQAERPEPDWAAFSAGLRSGLEEPSFEEPASHNFATIFFAVSLSLGALVMAYRIAQYLSLNGDEWRALTNTKSSLYTSI